MISKMIVCTVFVSFIMIVNDSLCGWSYRDLVSFIFQIYKHVSISLQRLV